MWKNEYTKFKEMAEIPEEEKKYRIIYLGRPFEAAESDYYAVVEKAINVMTQDGWEVVNMRDRNDTTLIVFEKPSISFVMGRSAKR